MISLKLLPLRLLQLVVKPLSGKGLGDIRVLRFVHQGLTRTATPRKTRININGYKMEVNMRMGGIARNLVFDHQYEKLSSQIFKGYAQNLKTRCVVDIGANIGYYTLLAATVLGESGKVYAFEPDKNNLGFLKRNLEINHLKNVIVTPNAVSDTEGDVEIYLSDVESGEHSLIKVPVRTIDRTETIHTITLDGIVKEPVGLIKIDVEGAEVKVLHGAGKIIQRDHPVLIIECWEDGLKASGESIEALLSLINGYGYDQINMIDEFEDKTVPATAGLIRQYYDKHHFSINLLCVYGEASD